MPHLARDAEALAGRETDACTEALAGREMDACAGRG
jgi:hypothetical protein